MAGDTLADLNSLLQQVSSPISTLLSDYGNVGMSIGVSKGEDQAFLNLGQTQIGGPSPANDTIYLISSMTKPIVAIALSILVNEHNISMDTPASDILSQLKYSQGNYLQHSNQQLKISNLVDLQSEFHKATNLWESPNGHIPWQGIDLIISLLCDMPRNPAWGTKDSFVNNRNYVNECFSLLGAIIEKVTNIPFARFMREKVFEPLGMKNTFITLDDTSRMNEKLAKSHSTRVEETLTSLRNYEKSTPTFARIEEYVGSSLFTPPPPVEVNPSKVSDGTENVGSTPLAAAAGIRSTTADILTLSSKLIAVYNSPQGTCQRTKLERAIASMLDYIEKSAPTCTYAAGWNRVLLPWDPTVLDPEPRLPGADGDNARRLKAAVKESCRGQPLTPAEVQKRCQTAWPFFQSSSSSSSSSRDLALYHGGNMVGATSFWFLIPKRGIAVTVLCNTRGFFLDAANLTCMFLADAIYSGSHQPLSSGLVQTKLTQSMELAKPIAANYLSEVVKYEDKLSREFPVVADNETYAASCAGTYQFCEGIFATVSRGEEGENEQKKGGLVFQLYGSGFRYPLRVRTGKAKSSSLPSVVKTTPDLITLGEKKTVEMTFAIPMSDLTPTGVGGGNRLDVEDFVIIFGEKDEDNGGKFGLFSWNFAKAKSTGSVDDVSSPPPVFAFKRVE